ncbi:MAG TPA: NAD(P)-dependent oxidoreductase, partial [Burkholderiales bacterium]
FIGLGVMGEPICRNLAQKSGQKMCAYDPLPEPLARLKANGVEPLGSVREVAEKSDIVFLSLPGGKEVKLVAAGPGSLLIKLRAGGYIVDLSTTPVVLVRELRERFSARGIHFIDAPVARTREAAEQGTLSCMVGGTEAEFQRMKPYLAHFATDIVHCGAAGAGQAMKLLNNMILFQNVVAIAEALTVIRKIGIDPALALDVLAKGSADSFALRNHGMKSMLPGAYPERAFSVEYARKDLGYFLELAKQLKLELSGASNARAVLDKASAAGLGSEYYPALLKVIGQ